MTLEAPDCYPVLPEFSHAPSLARPPNDAALLPGPTLHCQANVCPHTCVQLKGPIVFTLQGIAKVLVGQVPLSVASV